MHLALLITCAATLLIFVVCAGACFTRHGRGTAGCHMVKVTGPVSVCAEITVIWITPPPHPILGGAGIALFVLALAVFLWALAAHQGKRLTRVYCTDPPERLVTRGPYAWMRHPCYTAYLLAFGAGLVATASPWLVPVVVGNGILYANAARAEERKFARSDLAQQYELYQKHTGMFLPNPLKQRRN